MDLPIGYYVKQLALFGYGGHAREVAAILRDTLKVEVTHFVDDQFAKGFANPISSFDPTNFVMMVAVADPWDRAKIVSQLPVETEYFSFVHDTALLYDAEVGIGSFIGPYCILTTNVKIGDHAILNRAVHVGHDCRIGNYFSAMSGSIVSGNCSLSNNIYLGNNACIREKISVGPNTTIGMGAMVVSNILKYKNDEEHQTYVGVPAKALTYHGIG